MCHYKLVSHSSGFVILLDIVEIFFTILKYLESKLLVKRKHQRRRKSDWTDEQSWNSEPKKNY
jgi:hypothetical protein